jgi:hypothetical protein
MLLLIKGYIARSRQTAALLAKRRSISKVPPEMSPAIQESIISRPKAGLTRRLGSEALNQSGRLADGAFEPFELRDHDFAGWEALLVVPAPALKFEHWVDQDYFAVSGVGAQLACVKLGPTTRPDAHSVPRRSQFPPLSVGATLQIHPSVSAGG